MLTRPLLALLAVLASSPALAAGHTASMSPVSVSGSASCSVTGAVPEATDEESVVVSSTVTIEFDVATLIELNAGNLELGDITFSEFTQELDWASTGGADMSARAHRRGVYALPVKVNGAVDFVTPFQEAASTLWWREDYRRFQSSDCSAGLAVDAAPSTTSSGRAFPIGSDLDCREEATPVVGGPEETDHIGGVRLSGPMLELLACGALAELADCTPEEARTPACSYSPTCDPATDPTCKGVVVFEVSSGATATCAATSGQVDLEIDVSLGSPNPPTSTVVTGGPSCALLVKNFSIRPGPVCPPGILADHGDVDFSPVDDPWESLEDIRPYYIPNDLLAPLWPSYLGTQSSHFGIDLVARNLGTSWADTWLQAPTDLWLTHMEWWADTLPSTPDDGNDNIGGVELRFLEYDDPCVQHTMVVETRYDCDQYGVDQDCTMTILEQLKALSTDVLSADFTDLRGMEDLVLEYMAWHGAGTPGGAAPEPFLLRGGYRFGAFVPSLDALSSDPVPHVHYQITTPDFNGGSATRAMLVEGTIAPTELTAIESNFDNVYNAFKDPSLAFSDACPGFEDWVPLLVLDESYPCGSACPPCPP